MEGSNRVSTIMMVRRGQCQRVAPAPMSSDQTQPPDRGDLCIQEPPMSPERSVKESEEVLMPVALTQSKLCRVCEEKSATHRHYGGQSCLSCKAFFRRAVTSRKRERVCKFRKIPDSEALCGVRKCAACRYKRCIDSGMRPEMVLSGKKEALRHLGRVNKDTLEKLRQLEKEDVEDEKKKGGNELNVVRDNRNAETLMETDLDTIEPSLPASPTVDLVLEDRGALFMATLSAQFTRALEHLSIFSPRFTVGDLLAPESSYSHALVFTSLQDYIVHLVLLFLKHNSHFQAHSWCSQTKLLKKNLPEMSFIVLAMFFDRHRQSFQWSLCPEDFDRIRSVKTIASSNVEIKKSDIISHFGPKATKYVFEVANKLSELQLPKSVLLLLILVSVFTREDLYMDKQDRVDSERKEYLKMIYTHLQSTAGSREAGHITARIHSSLVVLRQLSANIRDCEVNSVTM